ncbi:MAG: hypothetical protein WA138_07785 [Parvibaculum sp.]
MSKLTPSGLSTRQIAFLALGLVIFVALGWKMTVDYFAAREADALNPQVVAERSNLPRVPVDVKGFRSAMFGDNEAKVRAAITKDFGVKDENIRVAENEREKTKLLAIRVKDVVADSGVAEIVYVLGHSSKALIQVNIIWNTQFAKGMTPKQLGATASVLGHYFAGQGFVPGTVSVNKRLPNGVLRVFSGRDAKGRLVTLLYQQGEVEVKSTPAKDGKVEADKKDEKAAAPEKRRIAALRLNYVADPENPDIFKIDKGKF